MCCSRDLTRDRSDRVSECTSGDVNGTVLMLLFSECSQDFRETICVVHCECHTIDAQCAGDRAT